MHASIDCHILFRWSFAVANSSDDVAIGSKTPVTDMVSSTMQALPGCEESKTNKMSPDENRLLLVNRMPPSRIWLPPDGECSGGRQAEVYYNSGAAYVGCVRTTDGRPHGCGAFTSPSGFRYIGEYDSGRRQGQGMTSSRLHLSSVLPSGGRQLRQWRCHAIVRLSIYRSLTCSAKICWCERSSTRSANQVNIYTNSCTLSNAPKLLPSCAILTNFLHGVIRRTEHFLKSFIPYCSHNCQ